MKKLFLAMIVCAGFCACSNDDVVVTTTPNEVLGEATAYLTVNIKDVNSGTRASDGGFAYGTELEQRVRSAYFYFYNEDGDYMAKGSLGSISGTANDANPTADIEWNSGTVVAIYGLEEGSLPTKMVTVLNKPSDLDLTNKSLDEVEATLANASEAFQKGSGGTTTFVMTTSVYTSNGSVVNYTELQESDFALEPIDLEDDYADGGVAVYVERLAAKVQVNDAIEAENTDGYIDITDYVAESFVNGAPEGGIYVKLDGFDVNGIARDSYVLKDISDNANWSSLSFVWNDATDYRSYWAESPNYGLEVEYPTSSNGNTATDENNSSTWLNDYLRYVNLKSPTALGSAAYCCENTNTVGSDGVIDAADNNGLTNVLVKGTVYTLEDNEYVPLDIVEFHGAYYTADDFTQKCVDDVVEYDFTIVVDEVIAALKEKYPNVGSYLDELNAAIIKDYIYKSPANENHKYGTGVSAPSAVTYFGGEMLSLYNVVDGNVNIFYNMTTQPQWGEGTTDSPFTNIDNTLWSKYPKSNIVYNESVDLDDYDFWFHIDSAELGTLERIGLTGLGLIYQIPSGSGDYYMPIDNSISFTTEAMGDDNFSGGHTYTTRNFLLRTITVEADGIDGEFGSHYPNLFANGEMYYHVPIEHLGSSTSGDLVEGEYGVVRNHYYNVNITSLENLGRGIADEDEVIVPLPDVDYYYLGADIDILSWKMVNQEVGF